MRKMKVISGTCMLLLTLILSAMCGVRVYAEEKASPVILEGVFIDSVDVSRMTMDEADQAIQRHFQEIGGYNIQMQFGSNVVSATASDLGLCFGEKEVLQRAADFGQTGNIVKQYKAKKDLERDNVRLYLNYSVDVSKTENVLTQRCAVLDCEPMNASMTRSEGEFQIIKEKQGVTLLVDEAKQVMADYLSNEWRYGLGYVELPAEIKEAEHKADELTTVSDLLASSSTDYSSSSSNRAKNIERAAELINGLVVYPGETISVTELVVPFSEANGYLPAPSYENGDVVDSYGGGICQVSSTLYLSLLRAELEITERHNHSMIVSYVKPSMDAAIAEGYKDLKFKNNLDTPIYIDSYTDGDDIGFAIYGKEYRSEDREVTYQSETLETIEPEVKLTASQDPLGTVTQTGTPHTGYVACLWKIVTVNGEETKEKVNSSTYNMSPSKYSVGVKTDDSDAQSEIYDAISTNDLDEVYEVIYRY